MVEYNDVRYLGCTGCAHARCAYGQLPCAQQLPLPELCCWINLPVFSTLFSTSACESTMSTEREPSGVTPLTCADIPDLVRAVVAKMKKTTDVPPPGKPLNGTEARSQGNRDDQRTHAADRQF